MKELKINELSNLVFSHIDEGALMTTFDIRNNKVNTMTISWGGISRVWNKYVFVAYVRYTRDTYKNVEDTKEFTINIPLDDSKKDILKFCGVNSGRDYDKVKECNLTLQKAQAISTPIFKEFELNIECDVIYSQALERGMIPSEVKDRFYSNNNYHVVYYGEIKTGYVLE